MRDILRKEKSDYSKIALFQLNTGMRAGELLARSFSDYDSKNHTLNIHNLIFWNYKKNNFYTVSSYNSYLLRLNDKYKITNRLTTHVLRHTRITRVQKQRIPLVVIQYCVGHVKGSSITNNIYTSVSLDFVKQELNINKTKKGCN